MNKQFSMLATILFLFVFTPLAIAESECTITCIDVGEGESFLIQTPSNQSILIDTGNLITGNTVHAVLTKKKINTIDHLIITHPHPDHAGGIFSILPNHETTFVYDNGELLDSLSSSNPYYRWFSQLVRSHHNYRPLAAGDILHADNLTLSVLWPYPDIRSNNINDNSLVMLLQYNQFRMLFMSDVTTMVEQKIRERGEHIDADILKVSHHGHNDSSSEGFLGAVSPQISIISINKKNINHYPSPAIIERLTLLNSAVLTTYDNGTITIRTNGDGTFSIETSK